MAELENKTAIVTGGSKGIGQGIVEAFLREGTRVVIADVDDQAGKTLIDQLGGQASYVHMDVTKEEDWQKLFAQVDRVDILVNDAGIGPTDDIETITLAEWNKVLNVDLNGVLLGTHYGVLNMKEHGGSIINIASLGGDVPAANMIAYGTAKSGVVMLSKDAAAHCRNQGYKLRVNTINPGPIATPLFMKSIPEETKTNIQKKHLMGTPDDIGQMAVFLASDRSTYCNGGEFVVDGALSSRLSINN